MSLVGNQGERVPRVSWAQHRAYLYDNWEPGEHVSIIDPTGNGKSYLATRGLLPLWADYHKGVVLLDTKGDDETLIGVGHKVSGYPLWIERVKKRPPIFRVVVRTTLAGVSRTQQRLAIDDLLRKIYRSRGWVLVIDELKTLVKLNMTPQIEDLYERGRRRNPAKAITVIGLSQAPSWIPSCCYTQPRVVYLGSITDTRHRKRLGEIGGNSKALLTALGSLEDHEFVAVAERGRRMEIIKVGR